MTLPILTKQVIYYIKKRMIHFEISPGAQPAVAHPKSSFRGDNRPYYGLIFDHLNLFQGFEAFACPPLSLLFFSEELVEQYRLNEQQITIVILMALCLPAVLAVYFFCA